MKALVIIHTIITIVCAALAAIALCAALFCGKWHCLLTAAMLSGLTWVGIHSIKEAQNDVAGEQSNTLR